MARLTLSYQNLYDEVSFFLGLTARGTTPTGANLTLCKALVDRGIRQFLYPIDMETGTPHEWEFLKVYWDFTTTSGQWKYALPVDFSDVYSTLYFDTTSANPPLLKRSAEQILEMRTGGDLSGYPEYFAITPLRYDIEIGSLYELWLHPTPGQAETLSGFYRADPVQLSATTDLVIGGIRAIEAILESCLAVAEHQEDDMTSSHHTAKAAELIQKLIKFDKVTVSDKIGNLYTDKYRVWPKPRGYFTYPDFDNNVYP
ncbi:MAG: hypothetical protein E3J87_09585 [Candidatus Cloacimonadota bacterium]|nr:MAG: hypothetical protein E3J87_09585 [Candidatus Cloacimonadota bacterium]